MLFQRNALFRMYNVFIIMGKKKNGMMGHISQMMV